MLPTQLVAVNVAGDDSWRMIDAFWTSENKETFIRYLVEDLDASTNGDWYIVASDNAGNAAIERVRDLGGDVFSLNQV